MRFYTQFKSEPVGRYGYRSDLQFYPAGSWGSSLNGVTLRSASSNLQSHQFARKLSKAGMMGDLVTLRAVFLSPLIFIPITESVAEGSPPIGG